LIYAARWTICSSRRGLSGFLVGLGIHWGRYHIFRSPSGLSAGTSSSCSKYNDSDMDMSIWTSVRPMFEGSLDQTPHLEALVVALSVAWGVWGSWRTKEKKNDSTFGSQNRHDMRSLERGMHS
jgi:hypothetical protein